MDFASAPEVSVADVAADLDAANTPPPMSQEDFHSLTGVTGASAFGHHGVPERVPGSEPAEPLTPFEGYLLSRVDGATYVDDVVAASGLSVFEAAKALGQLKDKELIRFRKEPAPRPAPLVPGKRRGQGSSTRLGRIPLRKGVPLPPPLPKEDVEDLMVRAVEAQDAADYGSAREAARMALMAAPDNPRAAAVVEALESPKEGKKRARVLHDLGAAAHRAGDFAAAVEHFRGALQEFEPSAVIHHKLSMVLVLAGVSFDEAEAHLLRAMQLQPENRVYADHLQRLREMRAQALLPPRP